MSFAYYHQRRLRPLQVSSLLLFISRSSIAITTSIIYLFLFHILLTQYLILNMPRIILSIDSPHLNSLLNNRLNFKVLSRTLMNVSMKSTNVLTFFIFFFPLVQEQSIISLVELLFTLHSFSLMKTFITIFKSSIKFLGYHKHPHCSDIAQMT